MITAVPVDFADPALEAEILDDLARVEASLLETAHPDEELFTEAARHSIVAGGKRFRALLVLLAAQFGDPRDPRVIEAAVAIELTHLATLFHDDVMDEADVRRGLPSVNSRWSNSVAILTGDFLFAQASRILARLGPEAVRLQAETFNRLVAGQLAETIGARPGQDLVDHYMHVITEKTGSLIATSGQFGALFSGAPAEVAARIAAACEQIGVAWQLSDDVIDIASDPEQADEGARDAQKKLRMGFHRAADVDEDEQTRSLAPLGAPDRVDRQTAGVQARAQGSAHVQAPALDTVAPATREPLAQTLRDPLGQAIELCQVLRQPLRKGAIVQWIGAARTSLGAGERGLIVGDHGCAQGGVGAPGRVGGMPAAMRSCRSCTSCCRWRLGRLLPLTCAALLRCGYQ